MTSRISIRSYKRIDLLFLLTPPHPKKVDFTTNISNGAEEMGVIGKMWF
jgi:hypothetical protein